MYLFDGIWSTQFLYALFTLSVVTWVALKYLFQVENFWNALLLAFIVMIFLPFISSATQTLTAFLLLIAIGALFIQQIYRGASFVAGVVAMLVVFIVGSMILPSIY